MQVLLWIVALSLLSAAAGLGVIAWRMARGVRERESARVQLLKALAFPEAAAVPASGPSISSWTPGFVSELETAPAVDAFEPAPSIFGERGKSMATFPRWWIALFAVGAAIVLVVTLYAMRAGSSASTELAPAAAATPAPPIELVALQHRLGKANAFDLSGIVRNPAGGRALPQLMAIVDLLDSDGHVLTSQMTLVERPVLDAGQTSAFSVVFPHVVGTVASYQVGFRLKSGDTIMHVDRRTLEPAATAGSF